MRTLVISGEYPWPVNSGSRLRLLTILRGLRRCGPTELFSVLPNGRSDIDPPDPELGLERVGQVGFDDRPPTGPGMIKALAGSALPLELPTGDSPRVCRDLVRFASGHYDLIWYFGVRAWALTGSAMAAPSVVDLVDLEDRKIAARLSVPRAPARGPAARLRQRGARALSEEEIRRWRRLQRRAASSAGATVVCSDLDAARAIEDHLDRVMVVPNAYRRPDPPVGGVEVGSPPTVLFQGTLRYPPNAEAARFLVEAVAPELRRLVPDVRIRLVGVSTPSLDHLGDPPRVTVVGRVDDITDELARADVVVVPLRFGSGTRLKVLEAFAHRIPVVSTTLGAEGLGAVDGVHLLLADEPESVAAAVARLLADTELRRSLTDRAHQLYLDHFDEALVERRVADLAESVVSGAEGT